MPGVRTRCQESAESKSWLSRLCHPRPTSISSQCSENPSKWALHVVNELPLSTYGRVALIGDAVRFSLLTKRSFDEIM